jgi:farnesyl-diphosphate farnesyltransferase
VDTIEDDMTIPDEVKQPILRSFHKHAVTPGWTFDGCGPSEKDRQLLVEFDVVVEELNRLQPMYVTTRRHLPLPPLLATDLDQTRYRDVIIEVCEKAENGVADFAHKAAVSDEICLEKIEDWNLYCHYAAGLVGEGLSRLFAASGKEQPWLADQLELSNSMGLLLQKTNIIRDYREDVEQRRYFWPKEIWAREEYSVSGHGGFKEMKEMCVPENEKQALWVISALVMNVLQHVPDCLDYLGLLKNQTVFNFCAIPQVMAIATLNVLFMNPQTFQRNVKIGKAEAAGVGFCIFLGAGTYMRVLIMKATNSRDVAYLFRDYARRIHVKSDPKDPSFLKISVSCGHVRLHPVHRDPCAA